MKRSFTIFTICLLLCMLMLPASADIGPKPAITVTVVNPPDGTYYLDLLIETEPGREYTTNLYDHNSADVPDAVRELLDGYCEGGWHTALTHGTRIPLFGSLTGEPTTDREHGVVMVHHFSYYGTPTRFKLILVTPDGETAVSPVIERKTFYLNLTYDYAAADVISRTAILPAYLTQFAITCTATLLIEGVLLVVFGLARRKNWLRFLCVNLLTQLALTATSGSALIFSGEMAAYSVFLLCEVGILILESIVYAFWLEGHTKGRRVAYALTANIASAAVGWIAVAVEASIIF